MKNETDKGQHFYQNLLLITQESHVFITQLRLQSLHCYNLNEMLSQLAVLNKCSKSQQAEPRAWSLLHHFLFRVSLTPRANKIRETKIVKYSCAKHASHCKNRIVNMTYCLSFWLQMSEPITHIDMDNCMTIHKGTS